MLEFYPVPASMNSGLMPGGGQLDVPISKSMDCNGRTGKNQYHISTMTYYTRVSKGVSRIDRGAAR